MVLYLAMFCMCTVQYQMTSKYTLSSVIFGWFIDPAKRADILGANLCFSLHSFGADSVKQSEGNLVLLASPKEALRPGSKKGSKAKHIGLSISRHGLNHTSSRPSPPRP